MVFQKEETFSHLASAKQTLIELKAQLEKTNLADHTSVVQGNECIVLILCSTYFVLMKVNQLYGVLCCCDVAICTVTFKYISVPDNSCSIWNVNLLNTGSINSKLIKLLNGSWHFTYVSSSKTVCDGQSNATQFPSLNHV